MYNSDNSFNKSYECSLFTLPFVPTANQTRKFRSPYETSSFETKGNDDEYIMLQDATISVTDISKSDTSGVC